MSPNNNTSAPQSNTMGRVAKEAVVHVVIQEFAGRSINAGEEACCEVCVEECLCGLFGVCGVCSLVAFIFGAA